MSNTFLSNALRAARETRSLELGPGTLAQMPRVFREQFGDRAAVVVADENTWKAAGEAVAAALRGAGIACEPCFVFKDPRLYAEHRFVEQLQSALRRHEAIPVAVGSGTINDLTKLASHRTERPYLCVATAASMDGYTAYGASITYHGSKQTFFCPAPRAVVADLDILCAAPAEMSAWGYADLLAKVPAGADWIVADALGAEAMNSRAWEIVQGRLRESLDSPAAVRSGSAAAIGKLTAGLMLGGFAMQWAQSSRPASGAEHQFSHLWDMQHHTHRGRAPSHGFKVGLGTLAATALYEELLRQPLERLEVERCCQAWPELDELVEQARALLVEEDLIKVAVEETRAKYADRAQLRSQLTLLRSLWPALRERLKEQLLPLDTVREKLQAVGAPTEPEQIGISRERLRRTYWQAYFIRRRFTVLDLAARTELLNPCLDRIFGPHGVWPILPETATSGTRLA